LPDSSKFYIYRPQISLRYLRTNHQVSTEKQSYIQVIIISFFISLYLSLVSGFSPL